MTRTRRRRPTQAHAAMVTPSRGMPSTAGAAKHHPTRALPAARRRLRRPLPSRRSRPAPRRSVAAQEQGESGVIHIVADRIVDLTALLHRVGEVALPRLIMTGDGATHGGPIDPGTGNLTASPTGSRRNSAPESWPPRPDRADPDIIPIRSRDFH